MRWHCPDYIETHTGIIFDFVCQFLVSFLLKWPPLRTQFREKKRNEGHKQIVPNTKGIVNVLSCNLNFVYKRFSIRSCENACSLKLKTMGIEWSSSSKKKKKSISTAWHGPDPHLKIRLLYTAYYFIDLTSELLLFFERNGLNTGTKMCLSPVVALHLLF